MSDSETTPEPDHTDPEWLRQKYIAENMTQKEIGNLVGEGRHAICNQLRNHNITKSQLLRNRNIGRAGEKVSRTRSLNPVTDESTVLVQGGGGNSRRYHKYSDGDPACGVTTMRDREPEPWDIADAKEWANPCQYCYHDELFGDENNADQEADRDA